MRRVRFFTWAEALVFLILGIHLGYFLYDSLVLYHPVFDGDTFSHGLFLWTALTTVFGIGNIASAWSLRRTPMENIQTELLWRTVIRMKAGFIPIFVLVFFWGTLLGMYTLFYAVTIFHFLALMAAAWTALLSSSAYCILLLWRTREQRRVSQRSTIAHSILQLIFVLDVIDVFMIRKQIKESDGPENHAE